MRDDVKSAMHTRGAVADRPWGLTLGALGLGARTVQLTLRAEDKVYRVAFDRGVVVAASSPLAVDSVCRVALTNHHITPAQVKDIKRRVAAAPTLDEVDVLAAAVRLTPEQTRMLRTRLVTQRAARTFSVDHGQYEIEDRAPLSVAYAGIDIRSVIYQGVRMNLSEERLAFDLREFGTRFVLKCAIEDLACFGFTASERPILDALLVGTSLPEFEAAHRQIDPRAVKTVIYALASCDALAEAPAVVPAASTRARGPSPQPLVMAPPGKIPELELDDWAVGTPSVVTGSDSGPWEVLTGGPTAMQAVRAAAGVPKPFDEGSMETKRAGVPRSMIESFRTGKMTTVRPNALAAHEVISLIEERTAMLERGTDHFTLLGVTIGAPIEEIHAAYVELSRHLQAKRLAELNISDEGLVAQQLLAQIGIAFTVLTDRVRRPEYLATLQRARRQEEAARRR